MSGQLRSAGLIACMMRSVTVIDDVICDDMGFSFYPPDMKVREQGFADKRLAHVK